MSFLCCLNDVQFPVHTVSGTCGFQIWITHCFYYTPFPVLSCYTSFSLHVYSTTILLHAYLICIVTARPETQTIILSFSNLLSGFIFILCVIATIVNNAMQHNNNNIRGQTENRKGEGKKGEEINYDWMLGLRTRRAMSNCHADNVPDIVSVRGICQ